MHIFKETPSFNFLGKRNTALLISIAFVLISIGSIAFKGFTYGIDFRGGTVVQVQFKKSIPLKQLRDVLGNELSSPPQIAGFGDAANFEYIISVSSQEREKLGGDIAIKLGDILKANFDEFDIRRTETVGPKVGSALKEQAFYAVIFALFGILVYIWLRFQWEFGIGALAALFHDLILVLGVFALFEREITLPIVAALLTIVGYSLNDTIVILDRVRENIAKLPKKNLVSIMNISVNECLNRTIITSLTTFFVVFCLFIFGGEIIKDFSFAILIGLVVGTYSSVFVAGPTVIFLSRKRNNAFQENI